MAKKDNMENSCLWQARKRNFLGLPWTFTKYSLDEDKLYINTGFLNSTEDEIRLYRITDVTLKRSLGQKIFGMGTIHCDSSDVTQKNFDVKNIKDSKRVKDLLSRLVDESRRRNRVYTNENVNAPFIPHEGGEDCFVQPPAFPDHDCGCGSPD